METIKSLRQKGYKVRVMHERIFKDVMKFSGPSSELNARGGKTTIEVTTPDKSITVSGESVCSKDDNFDHKIGNQIALGRALAQLFKN